MNASDVKAARAVRANLVGTGLGALGGGLAGGALGAGIGAAAAPLLSSDSLEGAGLGAAYGTLAGALGGGLYGGYKGWQGWSGYSPKKATLSNYLLGPVPGALVGSGLGFGAGAALLANAKEKGFLHDDGRGAAYIAALAALTAAGGLGGAYLGNKLQMG